MKKLILLTLTAICISFINPSKIYAAVDISVGASTWYAWWAQAEAARVTYFDPTFFYGPAVSVKFSNDFNLTFVYLYGVYDIEESSGLKRDAKYKRNDADLALNYKLTDYLKAFAGIKYMPYKCSGTMDNNIADTEHTGIGPGLGVSATIPIIENLFALATLSGFYLWSEEDSVSSGKFNYKRYGLNTTLSCAYYITDWSTVASLGIRYQFYRSYYDTKDISWIDNYFYGITLAVTYNFSL